MLTVLQVAYPLAPVGLDACGGAEQILALLDEALVAAGHRSIVVACAGSRARGQLVTFPRPTGVVDDRVRTEAQRRCREAIDRVLRSQRVDVVHLHGLDFERYLPSGVPVLVTLHLPLSWYSPEALRAPAQLVCVSAAQAAGRFAVIPNGIDVDQYQPRRGKLGYVLALGRICPEKGFDLAIAAARRANLPLLLGGEVFPYEAHLRHFEERIQPALGNGVRWLGRLDLLRKRRLLRGAVCLLCPSLVPETSSLVAMEALASGTPVVARPVGALPDLVEAGRTGLFGEDVAQLAAAIDDARSLSAADCRRAAVERFSAARMVADYFDRYRQLTHRPRGLSSEVVRDPESIAAEWIDLWTRVPQATPFQRPEWLLPWMRHFGPRHHVIAVRDRGRLVALAALLRDGEVVRLAGTGITDYLDVLVDPAAGERATRPLTAALAGLECDFEQLRPDSTLLRLPAPAGATDEVSEQDPCTVLALPARPSWRLVRDIARARRRLDLRFRFAQTAGEVDELLSALYELHRARWQSRGQEGVLADATVQAFHRDAAKGFLAAGLLRLLGVAEAGRTVGVLYGFRDARRLCCYLQGFDPEYDRFSIGTVVLGHLLDCAHAEGLGEADFLRGRERYKARWGVVERANRRRRLWP